MPRGSFHIDAPLQIGIHQLQRRIRLIQRIRAFGDPQVQLLVGREQRIIGKLQFFRERLRLLQRNAQVLVPRVVGSQVLVPRVVGSLADALFGQSTLCVGQFFSQGFYSFLRRPQCGVRSLLRRPQFYACCQQRIAFLCQRGHFSLSILRG